MPDDTKRVELVSDADPVNRTGYIGLGLLGSLVLGFGPLSDALLGNGPFEAALGRFVVCVVFCVGAASLLGRLLDSAPKEEKEDTTASDDDGTGTPDGTGGNPPIGDDPAADAGSGGA